MCFRHWCLGFWERTFISARAIWPPCVLGSQIPLSPAMQWSSNSWEALHIAGGLSLQPAAGLVIFHISTASSGLKDYTILLISICKAIKFPYYQCRKNRTIITEIKNVLGRYFIKACLYRHVYVRFLEMNFTKNENSCWCLCIKYNQKHYLKNNII